MARRTKKVGICGKYGVRYGASLRKTIKKIEISQRKKYPCAFCGKDSVKRNAVGIWTCTKCGKAVAGGAYTQPHQLPSQLVLPTNVSEAQAK
ncbi:structural constituent of ribosome [Trichomonas vaginalis G3]|uniref:structural constituent of ribosome n=1 Tax=Trichomonas vaginalis (strain ATCC PRA-98 / G3) TaxID=412133 RepID=UPI0021E588B5|nr:structural constituent of ribosome [Trichomonas vaginalis G3]KAI5489496.1 structural constituent of ribosome [Trichomonas vaginalis G3]